MGQYRVYGRKSDAISVKAKSTDEARDLALQAVGDGWFREETVEIVDVEREDTTEMQVRKALGEAEHAVRRAIKLLNDGMQAARARLDDALREHSDCGDSGPRNSGGTG